MDPSHSPRNSVSDIFLSQAAEQEVIARAKWADNLHDARARLRANGQDEAARLATAMWLGKLGQQAEAIETLREGLSAGSGNLHLRYVSALGKSNRTGEAIEASRHAGRLFPQDIVFRFKEALILPLVYTSVSEVEQYRDRFGSELTRLNAELKLETSDQCKAAARALSEVPIAGIAYQGQNDRELQKIYGGMAHRIMAANYPKYARPAVRVQTRSGKLRVGYISSRFRDLSATRFFLGWLREHRRDLIDVYTWHVGSKTDAVTKEVRQISRFKHLPDCAEGDRVDEICTSVRAMELDFLIFLDVGIDPLMTQLAALRLAPIQCLAWDHPSTSGLPTMDYALSSELAEPVGAEIHYTETLVRLPGTGVSYTKPRIPFPLLRKIRADFGLDDNSVVYLCCQSIFKFLPGNDDVYVEIAKRVPNAQFVFVNSNSLVRTDFESRLGKSFAQSGLSLRHHYLMLSHMTHVDYWNLQLVSDVFLDSIGWSSGGSIHDAVACGIPVVTLRGDIMRARQGLAILTQAGIPETIAMNKRQYIDLAVKLATNTEYRRQIALETKEKKESLFSDRRVTPALESFLMGRASRI